MSYKQVILVRQDLKMPKGKLSAQVAHAAVEATLKTKKSLMDEWRKQGMKKVVLKVNNLPQLMKFVAIAKLKGLTTSTIKDAGKTFLKPGTITCAGIGPAKNEKIDEVTKNLKMV